jgi:TonB family protein
MECPDPFYSDEPQVAKVFGIVVLHLIVTEEGHVTNIQVKRSLRHGLKGEAAEAVGNWRFKPAVGLEGKPVPVWTDVEANFPNQIAAKYSRQGSEQRWKNNGRNSYIIAAAKKCTNVIVVDIQLEWNSTGRDAQAGLSESIERWRRTTL